MLMASSMPAGEVDTSKIDFYEFLSLPGPQASESEIKRAGRKTSLLYHPDKVAPTEQNLQNFHILQIAIGVLSDPAEKAKYDQNREAKFRRKAEADALDARRRKMKDDLENREKDGLTSVDTVAGQKRPFSEREMKMRRIQEENRRKVEEANARRRNEAEQTMAKERANTVKNTAPDLSHSVNVHVNGNHASDSLERSIKLRWSREGEGQSYDESTIHEAFEGIENVVLLKDKKRKRDGKKSVLATAVVVFQSLQAAKAAMRDKSSLYDRFDSIEWAGTKDPTND